MLKRKFSDNDILRYQNDSNVKRRLHIEFIIHLVWNDYHLSTTDKDSLFNYYLREFSSTYVHSLYVALSELKTNYQNKLKYYEYLYLCSFYFRVSDDTIYFKAITRQKNYENIKIDEVSGDFYIIETIEYGKISHLQSSTRGAGFSWCRPEITKYVMEASRYIGITREGNTKHLVSYYKQRRLRFICTLLMCFKYGSQAWSALYKLKSLFRHFIEKVLILYVTMSIARDDPEIDHSYIDSWMRYFLCKYVDNCKYNFMNEICY